MAEKKLCETEVMEERLQRDRKGHGGERAERKLRGRQQRGSQDGKEQKQEKKDRKAERWLDRPGVTQKHRGVPDSLGPVWSSQARWLHSPIAAVNLWPGELRANEP